MSGPARDGSSESFLPPAGETRLRLCIRRAILLPAFLFAGITLLTHVARYLGLPFWVYAIAAGVVTLLAAGLWFLLTNGEGAKGARPDRLSLSLLLVCALMGTVLSSIYRLPDADDYSYVPDAVHYLTYPSEPLGYSVHYAYIGEKPHFSIVEVTAQPFEYAQALLAFTTGMDYLVIYHMVAPALAGFFLPLSVFLLLSSFSRRTLDSVLGTLFILGLLTLLGESKIAIGSLSFTRLFQGKIVLIAVGIPAFASLSLDYLFAPGFRRWMILLVLSTALAGLSSTAFFLAPMLALVLGIAGFLALGPNRARFLLVAAYGLTLLYPVAYGLYASRSVTHLLTSANQGDLSGGTLFMETLARWIAPDQPVSAVVFAVSLVMVAVLARGFPRRMLAGWTMVACVLYLNPWVAPFWASHVTGELVYWRTVFALPFVAVAGTAYMACLGSLGDLSTRFKLAITAAILVCLAGFNCIPGSTSIFGRGGEVGLPGLKVREEAYQVALAVTTHVPPGVMLAPEEISGTTPMVRGGYPQVRLPDWELRAWRPGSSDLIFRASAFAEGEADNREDFLDLVQSTPALSIIVLHEDVFGSVSGALADSGFTEELHEGDFIVVWRPS